MAALGDLEDHLSCGLCMEVYDDDVHLPKLLHCAHTLCKDCLQNVISCQNTKLFPCPFCREDIPVLQINRYRSNISILDMMEFLKIKDIRNEELIKLKDPVRDKTYSMSSHIPDAISCSQDSQLRYNPHDMQLYRTDPVKSSKILTGQQQMDCSNHNEPITCICKTCTVYMCTKCLLEEMQDPKHKEHLVQSLGTLPKSKRVLYIEEIPRDETLLKNARSQSDSGVTKSKKHKSQNDFPRRYSTPEFKTQAGTFDKENNTSRNDEIGDNSISQSISSNALIFPLITPQTQCCAGQLSTQNGGGDLDDHFSAECLVINASCSKLNPDIEKVVNSNENNVEPETSNEFMTVCLNEFTSRGSSINNRSNPIETVHQSENLGQDQNQSLSVGVDFVRHPRGVQQHHDLRTLNDIENESHQTDYNNRDLYYLPEDSSDESEVFRDCSVNETSTTATHHRNNTEVSDEDSDDTSKEDLLDLVTAEAEPIIEGVHEIVDEVVEDVTEVLSDVGDTVSEIYTSLSNEVSNTVNEWYNFMGF